MKKTTLLFILFLTGLMACSTPEDKPKKQNNAAPAFQLFSTTNMWTFIKLECRGSIVDRKSTRVNSSHQIISYAVFCLKKKKKRNKEKSTTEWKSC